MSEEEFVTNFLKRFSNLVSSRQPEHPVSWSFCFEDTVSQMGGRISVTAMPQIITRISTQYGKPESEVLKMAGISPEEYQRHKTKGGGKMNRLWILGADSTEMRHIETLLRGCGETVAHASVDGARVTTANRFAVDSTLPSPEVEAFKEAHPDANIYLVECAFKHELRPGLIPLWLGYHRPGDLGYGVHPSKFLAASSIGQVIAALGMFRKIPVWWGLTAQVDFTHPPGEIFLDFGEWVVSTGNGLSRIIPKGFVYTAALSYLRAAYNGECPGIEPDRFARWRKAVLVLENSKSETEVSADIEAAQVAIENALINKEWITLAAMKIGVDDTVEIKALDMRRDPPYPRLAEAAASMRAAYVGGPFVAHDGRRKIVCSGAAEHIFAFVSDWAPAQGLVQIYGDPARGVAEGYLP